MDRRTFLYLFIQILFTNFCFCNVSVEKKQKIFNGFVDYLMNLPDQPYLLHDGILENIAEISENGYNIEVQFRGEDIEGKHLKHVKCSGIVYDKQENGVEVASGYQCQYDTESSTITESLEEVVTEWLTTDPPVPHQPIKLDNEVQTEPVTSGEQFIAVRRDSKPCIGCASQVDPEATGVSELALLGIRQLDQLEPGVYHSLKKVITVERQVQVVNGVRYVLTLLIDYNSCTKNVTDDCVLTKTCKISILDKPWAKLLDGSRYRVVVANNCTAEWLFEENDETLGQGDRDKPDNSQKPTPDYSGIPNTGSLEDIIQSVRNPDVQSQPDIEKTLTDEEIKNIQQQIIPNNQFSQQNLENQQFVTNEVGSNDIHAHQFTNLESHASDIGANPITEPVKLPQTSNGISEDKKKAIDDLLTFFDYAGFNHKSDDLKETPRIKRSYENELNMFNMAENFNKMRRSIDSAKNIYALAQSMVDYLNEMDMSVKNRILSSVISAEEEFENNKHYFYIQARIIIPCDKIECDNKDELKKICNGVVHSNDEKNPEVLTTFCYNDNKKKMLMSKISIVTPDDPVLLKLANIALKTIELESHDDNALRIIKIHNASTQKVSGTLTKLSILLGNTNCSKSMALKNRNNCSVQEKLGTKSCEVEILEKQWLKEKKISYICTDRPVGESFVNKKLEYSTDDPDVAEMVQDALQYLELQSNKNSKQKLVDVTSVSTQLVAGLLTNIEFLIGYTNCSNDHDIRQNNCELLKNEIPRNCKMQVWQRPWLDEERQMNVSCENDLSNEINDNEDDLQIRKKGDIELQLSAGGITKKSDNDPHYRALAEESLRKYLQLSGATEPHSVVTVDNVETQVVAGSLTMIDFTVSKNNDNVIKCYSKIWEQPWRNKKDINVTCNLPNEHNREKRQIPGEVTKKDSNDPRYRALAEKSLQKYLQLSGATEPHSVVTVDNVETQVVAGSLTMIDFTVSKNNDNIIKCYSKVWEQPWLNKTDIEVTCNLPNEHNREKRQIPGGVTKKDSNDPRYRALAEKSLQKYLQLSGATEPHSVVTVDNVETQVVAGSLTMIDFTVSKNNDNIIKCYSKVWEQPWLNKTDIEVTCNLPNEHNREKRQIPGGVTKKDSNDPRYRALAEKSLQKYLQLSGATEPHSVVTVDNVETQVVAGSLTMIDFTVSKNNDNIIKCYSKVWEQPWLNKTDIEVTCNLPNEHNREKRQIPGGVTKKDSNDPRYRALAEKSLQKYLQLSGATEPHSVVTVDNVETQVVAGSLTMIDFTVSKNNDNIIKCYSKVWEQPWLNKTDIEVTCNLPNEHNREKRQIPGGVTKKDSNDPRYRALAEKSLQKYLQLSGATEPHSVVTVDNVETQVVAGSLTMIDFTVSKNNDNIIKCYSKVWEQPWLNKTDIEVTCNLPNEHNREKRQIPGGVTKKDSNDPRYRALAEKSLQKYLQLSGATEPHSVVTVDNVETQVIAGSLTMIDFTVSKNNDNIIKCYSKVWEQPWLNKTDIEVTCNLPNEHNREKRQIPGGVTKKDSNDPRYRALAEKSLQKYLQLSGATEPHSVVTVDNVETQVVAGSLTMIDFTVSKNNDNIIKCYSKVWEQPWLNKTDIEVTCNLPNEHNREKRQIPGGVTKKDSNDPRYRALAEKSLQKYLQLSGATEPHSVVTVDNVETQVVAGSLTMIDFTVSKNNDNIIKCYSKVWEQPWLNKTDIEVTCNLPNEHNREKRQIPGGVTKKDSNDPRYRALAEKSLQKYLQLSGATEPHSVVTVDNVETQVVAGSLTMIDFTVSKNNDNIIKCYSKVWEQPWLNKTDIEVTCNLPNEHNREKRQIPGGVTKKDSNDPRYRALAEKSLQKYLQLSGATEPHSVVTVDNVETQVVAGSLTMIDFTVSKNNDNIIKCYSRIWEQAWRNKKDINVTCNLPNEHNREKRQIPGGVIIKDNNDPRYRSLAEDSLQKYLQLSGATESHRVVTVDNVKIQVVAGTLTMIHFTVLKNKNKTMKCYSAIWEQSWINIKEINVTCNLETKSNKRKIQITNGELDDMNGGFLTLNKNSSDYKKLIQKSLLTFLKSSQTEQHYKVVKILKAKKQRVDGGKVRVVFLVSPTNCQIKNDGNLSASTCDIQNPSIVNKCLADIWDKPRSSTKVYIVDCYLKSDHRQRREVIRRKFRVSNYKIAAAHNKVGSTVEEDPNKNEYRILADESLQKYQRLQKYNVRQKILQVKRVETQVVSGIIYKIDYTAVPTICSVNVLDTSLCDQTDEKVILYCHAEIWDRAWLKRRSIDVSCVDYDLEEKNSKELRPKRGIIGGSESKEIDNEHYEKLAEVASEKYMKLTKPKYFHKVLEIIHVSEKVVQGFLLKIEFSIAPTTCLYKSVTENTKNCPFQIPKAKLTCFAEILERPMFDVFGDDITVICRRKKSKKPKHLSKNDSKPDHKIRDKRQIRMDENEIDDDVKYVYAHHAVKSINKRSDTDNLQKLITIHDVASTVHMETPMVRMYIETAYTYCLKQDQDIDLNTCDELDGLNHKICFVKVFPSVDDELVVIKVVAVCDDEPDFVDATQLSIPDLLTISLVSLQNSPDIGYKLVHRGEPYVVPSLHSNIPVKLSFVVATTNCSKYVKIESDVKVHCFVDTTIPDKVCHSYIYMIPVTKKITQISANCSAPYLTRTKRTLTPENTTANIQEMVEQSLEKLEMSSLHRYKQRVIKINSYSTKLTSGRVTTIDFDVGYTNCLKYEWVNDVTTCEFIEHLPRRHCISEIWERLWLKNGRKLQVTCQDDETPLEAHVEFESADIATRLAQQALRHIEAKYPHPKKQQLVRIFSLEKQVVAGIHYRMKIEVGFTDCLALSVQENCNLINDGTPNRFCRVNVWLRPWTDHPPNFRVTCDYQAGAISQMYHHVQAEQLFFNFVTTYKPEYVNDHLEMTKRFSIFKENIKKIHELNTHERGTGVYAVTRFTDLTYEEFKTKYLGLNPSLKKPNQIPMRQAAIPKVVDIPASFDWRPLGAVTEVKDQGSCGSCWAFSVTGNIEGQWKMKTGKLLSLSEQELVDCDKLDDGCDGGYMDNAYRAIEELGGLETEDEYPYEGEDDKCTYNKTLSKVQISGAVNISSNETDMAKWLVQNGPISIGINANAMQFYVGGVSHPWKALCNPKNIDHGVLIVGYGIKEYPLFKKELPYWIVKNSWGPQWGEQGYYRVYRGDGTCGVNTMASSAIV